MKMISIKVNPAFKRTQPLPLLTADFAQRAGRAARAISQVMPVAGTWPVAALSVVGPAGKTDFNVPLAA